jgi:vacuolar iron transporter family protein
VLILSLAKLLSGAISMGVGDWMATAADVDLAKTERRREMWECDNYIEGKVCLSYLTSYHATELDNIN